MMYKSINLELPDYINRHFKRIDHGYNTWSVSKTQIPKCRTNMGQRSCKFLGAKDFNSLPNDIRNSPSVHVFKSHLIKHILSCRSLHYFIPS
jgi:hypothetical protein